MVTHRVLTYRVPPYSVHIEWSHIECLHRVVTHRVVTHRVHFVFIFTLFGVSCRDNRFSLFHCLGSFNKQQKYCPSVVKFFCISTASLIFPEDIHDIHQSHSDCPRGDTVVTWKDVPATSQEDFTKSSWWFQPN